MCQARNTFHDTISDDDDYSVILPFGLRMSAPEGAAGTYLLILPLLREKRLSEGYSGYFITGQFVGEQSRLPLRMDFYKTTCEAHEWQLGRSAYCYRRISRSTGYDQPGSGVFYKKC
ncbi:unnamed protein product [Schistocephalus solidus]|uniref:Peptidase A1 domain-containing protein n=1 Tax=Schistocephalus solidus TaxID=70667 RepID=A0A183SUK1_SCHSO|nr:unnamed protein product [Schistocephalus solidus]